MQKFLIGLATGIGATLFALTLLPASGTNKQIANAAPLVTPHESTNGSETLIMDELVRLHNSVNTLSDRIYSITTRHQESHLDHPDHPDTRLSREGAAQTTPEHMTDQKRLQFTHKKQLALDNLNDPYTTLTDFMASPSFIELPPAIQDEVMQELVLRFNNGEIDREQLLPGYKY